MIGHTVMTDVTTPLTAKALDESISGLLDWMEIALRDDKPTSLVCFNFCFLR